jgi:tRNA/rRNA methyltransferase
MGFRHLIVVDPKDLDLVKVLRMATHVASNIVKQTQSFDTLREALAEFNYVVGTTARRGKQRQATTTPKRLAEKLVSISRHNKIAIVFGPEDRGLSNDDIRLCDEIVTIPSADFSSLNLAQAVMIVCYELFLFGGKDPNVVVPRLAARHELEGLYDQLKDILVRISFINPENPDYWMNNIRRFFARLKLTAKEVNIIRGVCRQIDWYAGKCYKDGLNAQQNNPENKDSK